MPAKTSGPVAVPPVAADEDLGIDGVVDQLYGLEPSAFTAARNEAAKTLRKEKRKAAADAVAKLAKPTQPAWALNQIARRRPELVDALLTSGRQLRDAQDAVVGGRAPASLLQTASDQRRQAVRAVLAASAELGSGGDVRRNDEAARTLEAAAVDQALGQVLARGCLTGTVTDAVDFSGGRSSADDDRFFAAGLRIVPAPPPEDRAGQQPSKQQAAGQQAAERQAAEQQAAERQAAEQQAARQLAEQQRAAEEERRRVAAARARRAVDDARAALAEAERARDGAAVAVDDAHRDVAARQAETARARALLLQAEAEERSAVEAATRAELERDRASAAAEARAVALAAAEEASRAQPFT